MENLAGVGETDGRRLTESFRRLSGGESRGCPLRSWRRRCEGAAQTGGSPQKKAPHRRGEATDPIGPQRRSADQLLLAQILNAEGELPGSAAGRFGLTRQLPGGGDGHGRASGETLGPESQVGGWRVASGEEPEPGLSLLPPGDQDADRSTIPKQ